jgi:hypothetical protein
VRLPRSDGLEDEDQQVGEPDYDDKQVVRDLKMSHAGWMLGDEDYRRDM